MRDDPTTQTETDLAESALFHEPHQRSARNDPSMRDGDSGHGNPNEYPADEENSDRDVGDTAEVAVEATEEVGILDAVPAETDYPAAADRTDPTERADPTAREPEEPWRERDAARPAHPDRNPPIDGYQRLTVRQILAKLNSLSRGEVEQVKEFEESHRRRKTLLGQLERRLHGDAM